MRVLFWQHRIKLTTHAQNDEELSNHAKAMVWDASDGKRLNAPPPPPPPLPADRNRCVDTSNQSIENAVVNIQSSRHLQLFVNWHHDVTIRHATYYVTLKLIIWVVRRTTNWRHDSAYQLWCVIKTNCLRLPEWYFDISSWLWGLLCQHSRS